MIKPGSPVTASELRWACTLQAQANPQVLSAAGEPGDNWPNVADLRVSREALTGQELLLAKQLVAEASYRVRCWWRTDIKANMRLAFTDPPATLYIKEPPREIGWRQGLEFLCSEAP